MILTDVNFDVANSLVTCKLDDEVIPGVITKIDVTITDAELTLISPNWWLPEIKQVLGVKLGQTVS